MRVAPEQYIQLADNCAGMADRASDRYLKEQWLKLATQWLSLASEDDPSTRRDASATRH